MWSSYFGVAGVAGCGVAGTAVVAVAGPETRIVLVAVGSLSAYTVARLDLAWVKTLASLSVAARLVPLIVLMVPLYVLFRRYGLLNSLTGIVVADGSLMNLGTLGARGFHFAPLPVATSSAKRAAIVAGASVLR